MERNITLLAVFNFFSDLRFYSAVMVVYFAAVTGSFTLAMSLFSVIFVSSALLEIPTGIFSDRIGRKRTVVLGAASSVASVVCYAVGGSYGVLLAGAVLEGMARSFYSGNNDALLHDSLKAMGKHGSYDRYLGHVSAMFQAALTVGAAAGAVIASWSYAWVMWLSVIPQAVCLGLSLMLADPPRTSGESGTNVFSHLSAAASLFRKNPTVRLLAVSQILGFGIGESTFEFNAAFIASVWPTWAIGISKMISFIGGGLSYWYSGLLIRRVGAYRLMLIDAVYNRIANILAVIRPAVTSPVLMATTSFLYGATEVAGNSLMQGMFTDRERATLASMASLGGSLFFAVFSVFIGAVADRFGPATAILFAQICSVPRIVILWRLYGNARLKAPAYA